VPWAEASVVSLREEFVALATQEGANVRALCKRFEISPTTGYKYLARYAAEGAAGLADRSRRPLAQPTRCAKAVEDRVVALRDRHPAWGGRKLKRVLENAGEAAPAASTVTAILRRHDRLDPAEAAKHTAWQRFEHPAPNLLWQMDFKGHVPLARGRCHPLTILDDHSRFALAVACCLDEEGATVRQHLTAVFRRYGLPLRLLADNGSPWSAAGQPWTPLTVWLLRLGVTVAHGRPSHPQTQGKDERFHRTLKAEALRDWACVDLAAAQRRCDRFRADYNLVRPHEGIGMATPASRYAPSPRPFPEQLPALEYAPGDLVRKVQDKGEIWVRGRPYRVGAAFRGESIALRPTADGTIWDVHYAHHRITTLDLACPCR